MALDDELRTRNLYRFGTALQRIVAPEQGPSEPANYSVLDKIEDDDGLIINPPAPAALPKEKFEDLFGTINGRLRLGDGYMAMNQLSSTVESLVTRTFTEEETKLIMIGANMAIAAFVDEAQASALGDQFPDIS